MLYFNYKGFHSIVLLALVDADYKFLYADIGASGAGSDGGVFGETDLKEAFEDGSIGMPEPDPLPNDDKPMPYFIVGDETFPLKTWLIKTSTTQKHDGRRKSLQLQAFKSLTGGRECIWITGC